jgi:hypothetical protein
VLDRSALDDPECLVVERRKLVSELVPNLDKCVPIDERLRTFVSVVHRRDGGAGNGECEFSLSGMTGWDVCG